MSPEEIARFSDAAVMSAAIVFTLAMLSHIGEWAAGRSARREPELASDQAGDTLTATTVRSATRVELLGRIGVALTVLGFALNVAGLVARGLAASRVPWGNMYEFAIASTVGVAGVYLLMLRRHRLRWLGLPVTTLVVVTLMLSVLLLQVPAGPLVPALQTYWLYIHVSAAVIATGAFTVGALVCLTILVQSRSSARKAPAPEQPDGARMPTMEVMEEFAYRVHAFGFAVWTFAALIAGPIWARYAWGRYWGWDPKEVWAFITWVVYAAYLHARATAGWRGRGASVLALVGFATLVFNFVGINLFGSGLHSYAGL